jgi:hypothetical protein
MVHKILHKEYQRIMINLVDVIVTEKNKVYKIQRKINKKAMKHLDRPCISRINL